MVTGIVLSAGMGKRMGRQKLLLPFKGHTILEEIIKNAKASKLKNILIIYGEPQNEFEILCKRLGVAGIYNENYRNGQSQSVICGVKNSQENSSYMFLLGDQPFVNRDIINKILDEHTINADKIIIPLYDGERGNPVLFPNCLKDEFVNLKGDIGGREVIKMNETMVREIHINSRKAGFDIDTQNDYELAKEMAKDEDRSF
ncbi:molybdenum cofactor cytidylyltransferase [Oxobacter pfennigii]|uniref:Molybdenum cofactor cytidylyltransferase n=1 Tax=Oxobacter pfennigii TaxID=36849 RepID=A0A0P8W4P0_9CLOT|nr:molybdenum cofactor cytidylyltransferase [Oxobacter pfennigii]KPU42755.1 molybdenum cofactor cytidylyltransferase [Oxobacter pfennigii]